jgi:hypothetical protein
MLGLLQNFRRLFGCKNIRTPSHSEVEKHQPGHTFYRDKVQQQQFKKSYKNIEL